MEENPSVMRCTFLLGGGGSRMGSVCIGFGSRPCALSPAPTRSLSRPCRRATSRTAARDDDGRRAAGSRSQVGDKEAAGKRGESHQRRDSGIHREMGGGSAVYCWSKSFDPWSTMIRSWRKFEMYGNDLRWEKEREKVEGGKRFFKILTGDLSRSLITFMAHVHVILLFLNCFFRPSEKSLVAAFMVIPAHETHSEPFQSAFERADSQILNATCCVVAQNWELDSDDTPPPPPFSLPSARVHIVLVM
ncbi:hypothetical protein ACLOJK_005652 [Asimina triloba]